MTGKRGMTGKQGMSVVQELAGGQSRRRQGHRDDRSGGVTGVAQ